jgi:hypothetical protein
MAVGSLCRILAAISVDICGKYILSRRPLTRLENIGFVYPFYVYDGNRPLAPTLRQMHRNTLHGVKYPCDYGTDNCNPICLGIKGVASDVLTRAFLLLQQAE